MSRANAFSCVILVGLLAGCAGVKQTPGPGADAAVTGTAGTTGAAGSTGGAGTTGAAGTLGVAGTTGTGGTGEACTPSVVCNPPGGQYCGKIGNGCKGQTLDCGACASGFTCMQGLCVGDATCAAATCGSYCGTIGDNCGHALACAMCPTGQSCQGGVCVSPGCVPITCNGANNARFCGTIGDGCGGTLDCGSCPNGGTCGANGPNVCDDPTCKKITCTPMGGQYCGTIGDGCGGTLNCGACANGMACPTTGASTGVCPGSTGTGTVPPTCTGATKTTISGTVYDPAGVNPLYNVIVYVPSGPLPAIQEGVTCDKCAAQVNAPLASALTDTNGHFTMTLEPVPSTTNVPLVMQVGKWRRQITIPSLQTCKDNPLTDKNQTRLPKTSAEGHIPRIAMTSGKADTLECLARRIGIADSEFTNDSGNGRVHLYAGGGGATAFASGSPYSPATSLWSNRSKLANYDMLIMSCESSTSDYVAMKPQTSVDNLTNYANSGGRIFASHLHFYWLQQSPSFATTATYIGNLGSPPDGTMLTVNQTFPKGAALAQWLAGPVVAASTTLGQIVVNGDEHTVTSVNPPTSEWIYLESNPADDKGHRRSSQYLSFNTPVGTAEANQCGKVVFTDIHIKESVGSTGGDKAGAANPFPNGCKTNTTSPQGKALEFLFFDLSSCVEPPTTMPQPPIVPPPGVPATPPPSVSKPPAVPPPPPPPPPPNPG